MKKQLLFLAVATLAGWAPQTMSGSNTPGAMPGSQVSQQTGTATGTVVDENGEPLVGVSVTVKGQKGGQTTDVDGKFRIAAKAGSELQFNYVGYKPMSAIYKGQALQIAMQPTASNLDEVVVTAFGIKKDKKSLGYALDEVSADELMKIKTANPLNSLSGKVAGVNITQSSGAAGSGAQIVLRGATSAAEGVDNQPRRLSAVTLHSTARQTHRRHRPTALWTSTPRISRTCRSSKVRPLLRSTVLALPTVSSSSQPRKVKPAASRSTSRPATPLHG